MTRQSTRILFTILCLLSLAAIYLGIESIRRGNESDGTNHLPTATAGQVFSSRVGQSFAAEPDSNPEPIEPAGSKGLADLILQMRLARHNRDVPYNPYEFFSPLKGLKPAQLREAVEIVRTTMTKDPSRYDFDVILMDQWAIKEPSAAMAYAMTYGNVSPEMVLCIWSREDSEGAWQWYLAERKKDPANLFIIEMAGAVFGGMVANDPEKGFARLKTLHGAELSDAIEGISVFLRLEFLNRSVNDQTIRNNNLADRDRVLRHSESLPPELRKSVRESIISYWVSDDPQSAVAWVRSRSRKEINSFRPLLEEPLIDRGFGTVELLLELTPESEKPRAYATIAKGWHPGDLRDAMDWAKSIPDEHQRAIAIRTIHTRLSETLGVSAADTILAAPARTPEQRAQDKQPPALPSDDSIPGLPLNAE